MTQVEERKKKAKELAQTYQAVFESPNGLLILADLKKLSKFNDAIVPVDSQGRIDPYEVMRNEGKRAVMVHIEKQINKTFEDKQKRAE